MKSVLARIRWLRASEGGRSSPPAGARYSTVARFAALADHWPDEAWSVVLELATEPDENLSMTAQVRLLAQNGPANLLAPGSKFDLFEGARLVAQCEVLQSL